MKTITVRLPESLAAAIDAESRERNVSRSDVVRERLERASQRAERPTASIAAIADLIASVDGLPPDLSDNKKRHLRNSDYGRKRPR